MKGKCFLDTNVFVYSFDRLDARKSEIARRLIQEQLARKSGVISFQVVQKFFNVACKRMPAFVASTDAELYYASVLRPLFGVHSSPSVYTLGLGVYRRYKVSWYDSLIIAAAVQSGCEVIWTEDLQHGAAFEGVQVRNPFREDQDAPG